MFEGPLLDVDTPPPGAAVSARWIIAERDRASRVGSALAVTSIDKRTAGDARGVEPLSVGRPDEARPGASPAVGTQRSHPVPLR